MVVNLHERTLDAPAEACGALIDHLGTAGDRLWPAHRWPPMRFDGPLAPGTRGGHGPIRYEVERYLPGREIHFRFLSPGGFRGGHAFEVEALGPRRSRLRHVIRMDLHGSARLAWPLAIRWLHDACVEDALDCAERTLVPAASVQDRPFSLWVRFLRWALRGRRKRSQSTAGETP